jgi:hypothetical protein
MVKKLGKGVSLALVFGVPSVWLLSFAYSCSGPATDSFQTNPGEPDGEVDATWVLSKSKSVKSI